MQVDVHLVILLGNVLSYHHVADAVTKYACVSYSGGIGGRMGGYGGVNGMDWEFDGINSNSASSEELGMGFAGYGAIQHGIAPRMGAPVPNMSPGSSPLAPVPNMSPGTSPLAGGLSAQIAGGTASGLPNSAASLGGASHITGQGSNVAGIPGQTPFQRLPPGNPGVVLSGSLSCADRPQTTILITKLVYGNGGIYTCSAPDQDCDVVDYQDQTITPFCDGRVTCVIRTTGKLLPPCQATSNFVHVEYECIYPWSSFNICNDVKTVVREPEVYVMSPSFFQGKSPPSKTCECILKGRYDNRILAQYVHTDMHEAANHSCPESFVLFESKLSPNQTDLEKKTEVCGRRSLNNYLYRGDLRITFKDDDSGKRSGFVSKLLVPFSGMGVQVEIAMECGPVRLAGEPTPSPNSVNNNNLGGMPFPGAFGPYSPLGTMHSPFQQSPRIPAPPIFEGAQNMQNTNWGPQLPNMNQGPPNWIGPRNWGPPRFQLPNFFAGPPQTATTTSGPPPAWARNEKPPTSSNGRPPRPGNGRPPLMTATNKRKPLRSRIQSKDVVIETSDGVNATGRMAGYIVGGIGAVLTAFCALFISLYCTRRRNRIIERKSSERMEAGMEDSISSIEDTPVYTLSSAEDHVHPSERVNTSGHVNKAFDGQDAASGDWDSVRSGSFENLSLDDDDNYLSLEEVQEGKRRRREEDEPPTLELRVDSKYCQSREVVRQDHHGEESVYDNNI